MPPVELDAALVAAVRQQLQSELGAPAALQVGVQQLLEDHCANCHSGGVALGGVGFATDLAGLLVYGSLQPGDAQGSPLLGRLWDGEHPPPSVVQRPRVGQFQMWTSWVAQLPTDLLSSARARVEGSWVSPCEPAPEPRSHAGLVEALLEDAAQLPAEDQPYARYVVLDAADSSCQQALQQRAFFKVLAGSSRLASFVPPLGVADATRTFRIDLRDYGWDEGTELGPDAFDDAWQMLATPAPSAAGLSGEAFASLAEALRTRTPWLAAHELVARLSRWDVYYAALGLSADPGADALLPPLSESGGLDITRAGFSDSTAGDPARSEALITRFEPASEQGFASWLLTRNEGATGNESIFAQPVQRVPGPSDMLFQLPNGSLGFVRLRGDGTLAEAGEPGAEPGEVFHAVSNHFSVADCQSCHVAGALPVVDGVRPFYTEVASRPDLQELFPEPLRREVLNVFPPREVWDAVLTRDNQQLGAALPAASEGPEPMSRVYADYWAPLSLARAARELHAEESRLRAAASELPEALQSLFTGEGSVSRDAFQSSQAEAACVLHGAEAAAPLGCAAL